MTATTAPPASMPWEGSYPEALHDYQLDLAALPANAAQLAAQAAADHGDQPAFTFVLPTGANVVRSFSEVDALSDAFAAWLVREQGLQAGEVIALQMPNCLHYPIAVFGAWKAGLIVTNVNPLYTGRELRLQLEDSGARLLLVCDMFLQVGRPVAQALGVPVLTASLWDFSRSPWRRPSAPRWRGLPMRMQRRCRAWPMRWCAGRHWQPSTGAATPWRCTSTRAAPPGAARAQ